MSDVVPGILQPNNHAAGGPENQLHKPESPVPVDTFVSLTRNQKASSFLLHLVKES